MFFKTFFCSRPHRHGSWHVLGRRARRGLPGHDLGPGGGALGRQGLLPHGPVLQDVRGNVRHLLDEDQDRVAPGRVVRLRGLLWEIFWMGGLCTSNRSTSFFAFS